MVIITRADSGKEWCVEIERKKGQTSTGVGAGPKGIQELQRLGLGEDRHASHGIQCSSGNHQSSQSLPCTRLWISLHGTAVFLAWLGSRKVFILNAWVTPWWVWLYFLCISGFSLLPSILPLPFLISTHVSHDRGFRICLCSYMRQPPLHPFFVLFCRETILFVILISSNLKDIL